LIKNQHITLIFKQLKYINNIEQS